ncbi:MAG: hypothetical protein HKO07_09165, partial [Pseudomonadales bacterium]|nr:hypothetical protein [Pseudomonadales bacterium]
MPASTLLTIFLLLLAAAFYAGQRRAMHFRARQRTRALPFYHGAWFAVYLLLPACIVLALWSLLDGVIIKSMIMQALPEPFAGQPEAQRELVYSEVRRLAESDFSSTNAEALVDTVASYTALNAASTKIKYALSALLVLFSGSWAWTRLAPDFNARIRFERIVLIVLMLSAS